MVERGEMNECNWEMERKHIGEDSPVVGMPYFIKLLNHFISHMCIYILILQSSEKQ